MRESERGRAQRRATVDYSIVSERYNAGRLGQEYSYAKGYAVVIHSHKWKKEHAYATIYDIHKSLWNIINKFLMCFECESICIKDMRYIASSHVEREQIHSG